MTKASGLRWLLRFVVLGLALAAGCDDFEGTTIMSWHNPSDNVAIEVKTKLHASTTRVHMEVKKAGRLSRMVLIDSADLHDAALLRYNDWVLVLSGPYVLGGYDMQSDRIVPCNSSELPFTYHTAAGYPLVEKHLADGNDPEPFNFRKRMDR